MESEGKWNETGGSSFEGERDTQGKVHRTADKARSQVRSFADSSRSELADRIGGIARALRNVGEQLRSEEGSGARASQFTDMLADRADRVSQYLEEHDAGELIERVENIAKKNPAVFLGGCIALGFALGRFLKASPEQGEAHGYEAYGEEFGEQPQRVGEREEQTQMPLGVGSEGTPVGETQVGPAVTETDVVVTSITTPPGGETGGR